MKKILKKLLGLILTFIIAFNPILSVWASNNSEQIVSSGGTTKGDNVEISKTIAPSELENYFDITLKVQTQEIAKEQDVAVVIVMDISNTMLQYKLANENKTRLKAALDASQTFLETFGKNSEGVNAKRKIGVVAFNSNGHILQNMTDCRNVNDGISIASTIATKAKNITHSNDNNYEENPIYTKDPTRFTNIQAGLQVANDLLYNDNEIKNIQNKYVIFLSDGYPTTYIWRGYEGHATVRTDTGILHDDLLNRTMTYGTNYSERSARKAEEKAKELRNKGTIIYSIGTGIDNNFMTIPEYEKKMSQSFSTIDRYNRTNYAVGVPSTASTEVARKQEDLQNFRQWLGGKDSTTTTVIGDGIGSGYGSGHYFDVVKNSTEMKTAFSTIFENIKKLTEASWVAEDPMNSDNAAIKDVIEFVGIYDNKGNLYDSVKYNSSVSNNTSNNTASYNKTTDRINWNLKESKYIKTISGNKTYYNYEIKYRVRLKTEANNFKSEAILKTNGKTTLSYVVKETGKAPKLKTLQFKVPEVKGYLGTLTFNKLTGYNNSPLGGTTFELEHSDKCECMNERKHMNANFKLTSTSNSNGKVTFNNIPSGHTYKLKEVKTDDYHTLNETIYDVKVSYGKTTHNIENSTVINNINTKDLVIFKEVKNITTNKSFDFEINATYKEEKLNHTYQVIRTINGKNTNEEITFVDGVATFKLKHNESITIKDLPIKINFNIKELNIDGLNVKYQVNDGDIKKFNDKELENNTLENKMTIKFINSSGYVMPGTGSSGMLILAIIGTLLLLIPILYISVNILKKD